MKHTRLLVVFSILVCSTLLSAASNPVPLVYQPLIPASVAPGSPGFTLTVHGTGFVKGAVIKANGIALKTTFVSSTTLTAQVPAKAVATAKTASITVTNPGTIASNVVYFSVRKNAGAVVQLNRDNTVVDPGTVLTADFNNDQRPDIFNFRFGGSQGNGILETYFSEGTGQFLKAQGAQFLFPNALYPGNVAADFNNDGNMDVSVCTYAEEYSCNLYLGNGKGRFAAANGGAIESAADMNGDGNLDTVGVSTDFITYSMCVNLGNGDGTFRPQQCTPMNLAAFGIAAVGDFNGDGILDVAVAGSVENSHYVGVFLGNGDGTLQPDVDYLLPVAANHLAVADVNGDGKLDLITNGVTVLLGHGDGTFTVGSTVSIQQPVNASVANNIKIADFNGDGILDVATVSIDTNNNQILNVLLGNGDGTFRNPLTFAVQSDAFFGPEQDVGIADFNSDGLIDFVIGGNAASTVLLQVSQP
jgi:hypothetical protein